MPRYEYEKYGILWRWKSRRADPDGWQLYVNGQFPNQPMTFQRRHEAEDYLQNTEHIDTKIVIVEYRVCDEVILNGIAKKIPLSLDK